MIGDHRQASAGFQHPQASGKELLESLHLAVDFYAECLKELRHLLFLVFRGDEGLHYIGQASHGVDRAPGLTLPDYGRSHPARLLQLAVESEHGRNALLRGCGKKFGRAHARAAVHAHVERRIEPERESSRCIVEVMETNTEVGKNAVDPLHAVVAHKIRQETEIGVDNRKPVVGHGARHGLVVLVEGVEMSLRAQTLHNGTRMASAAVGCVDVNATWLYVKSFYYLGQKRRNMVDWF